MLTLWPPGPAAAEDVDAQVVVVDLDVDLLGLGHHQDAGGAGVHPALRLGDRHPLHAVHAALELEQARTAPRRARACPWPSPRRSPTCSRRGRTRWRRGSRSSSRAARRSGCTSAAGRRRTAPTPRRPRPTSPRGCASLASVGSRGTSRWRSRSSAVVAARRQRRRPPRRTPGPRRRARGRPRGRRRAAATRARSRTIGDSSAYRWLSRLASRWSAWVSGSASCCSSSACSATSPSTASNIGALLGGRRRTGADRCTSADRRATAAGTGARRELLALGACGGLLGVAGLEAGDAAAGVEDLLLAGVERVALRAHVGVDDAGGGGAAGGERARRRCRSPGCRRSPGGCPSSWCPLSRCRRVVHARMRDVNRSQHASVPPVTTHEPARRPASARGAAQRRRAAPRPGRRARGG